MKKFWMAAAGFLLVFALAVPGFSKGPAGTSSGHRASHHLKTAKSPKRHASHKSHHHSIPKVAKVDTPKDDGPPAGWH